MEAIFCKYIKAVSQSLTGMIHVEMMCSRKPENFMLRLFASEPRHAETGPRPAPATPAIR